MPATLYPNKITLVVDTPFLGGEYRRLVGSYYYFSYDTPYTIDT